jgi:elongation factor 3
MSPVAAPQVSPLPDSTVAAELASLASAPNGVEAKSIADSIALSLKKSPTTLHALQDAKIVDVVLIWASSKSGYERESAPVLVERICRSLGTGVEGVFIPLIPALVNLSMDKGQPVRSAVTSALNALIKICPAEGSRLVLDVLCRSLEDGKGWRSKVSALKAIEGLVKPGAEEYIANELGHVIPFVERAMHDTKAEVSFRADLGELTLISRSLPLLSRLLLPSVVFCPTTMSSSTSLFLSPPWPRPLPFPEPSRLFLPPLLSPKSTPLHSLSSFPCLLELSKSDPPTLSE